MLDIIEGLAKVTKTPLLSKAVEGDLSDRKYSHKLKTTVKPLQKATLKDLRETERNCYRPIIRNFKGIALIQNCSDFTCFQYQEIFLFKRKQLLSI